MRVSRPNRRYQLALWIDRRLGPPLCAGLLAAKRLFRRSPALPPEPVRRILVLKMWGMGSIVLATPLLERLRQLHPEARIDFVSLRENEPILELCPQIDRPVSIDLGRGVLAFGLGALRALRILRSERYDLLFDLEFFTRFSAIFSFLVGARRSHGFSAKGNWRGRLHDVEVPFNAYHHVALNFLTLLRDPMDPVDLHELSHGEGLPRLEARPEDRESCERRLAEHPAWREGEPLVVVNPNAGDMALERRWPLERMAELLKHLAGQYRGNIALVGSAAEREYVESVVRESGVEARISNLAGRLELGELVALLARAAVVVSNDSGPLHLAAAAGASTVALFGPETPTLYRPLRSRVGQRHAVHYRGLACSPCMFVHDNKVLSCWFAQARCMTGIQPADVLSDVVDLLAARDRRRSGGGPLRVVEP